MHRIRVGATNTVAKNCGQGNSLMMDSTISLAKKRCPLNTWNKKDRVFLSDHSIHLIPSSISPRPGRPDDRHPTVAFVEAHGHEVDGRRSQRRGQALQGVWGPNANELERTGTWVSFFWKSVSVFSVFLFCLRIFPKGESIQ